MQPFKPVLLFVLPSIFLLACPDPQPTPGIPRNKTPIPEAKKVSNEPSGAESEKAEITDPTTLASGPLVKRFSVPGSIRFTVKLDKPITFIRRTPLAGLVVSSGKDVHNITSQGENRFRFVAGSEHRLFQKEETEIVWSKEFGQLTQLMRRGRTGWTRKWEGRLTSDSRGEIYLIDASTVSAIDNTGQDRWRLVLDGVRRIDGPFTCEDSVLFQGTSGLKRLAVRVSSRGSLVAKTSLERGAVLIGAGPDCEPLVWLGNEVAMVDQGRKVLWKLKMPSTPFVQNLQNGFAFVSPRAELPAILKTVTDKGQVVSEAQLPINGRLTGSRILPGTGTFTSVIGLCSDVTSPCSKPDTTRGPFNALIMTEPDKEPRSLIRHVQGHLGFAVWPDGGLVTASSSNEDSTDITLRNQDNSIEWNVPLPGRLSAGPYIGHDQEVYVATCKGWDCEAPHLLFSITGKAPQAEKKEN